MAIGSKIEQLTQTPGFRAFMNKLYGIGASVVVLGALFKLEHWTGADYMLTAGLVTEAVIFFFYAFEPSDDAAPAQPHENDCIVSYAVDEQGNQYRPIKRNKAFGEGYNYYENAPSLALARFDQMLENGNINPDLLLTLGNGLQKLSETTEQFNNLGDVFSASNNYVRSIKNAEESLDKLAKGYEASILKVTSKVVFRYKAIAGSMETIEDQTRQYQYELENMSRNLTMLNAAYRAQLNGANNNLREMADSANETRLYKEQLNELNKNLATLNKMYKGMIKKAG